MKIKNIFQLRTALLVVVLLSSTYARSQSALDLRINEILVYNDSNYVDDFGQHSAWIEIFNSAYNSVDIGGLYLTDERNNPTKYPVAKGQPTTLIAPRSYIVFWADDLTTRGIKHLNFKIKEGGSIYLYDANGRTLIDSLQIIEGQKRDVTYGRLMDGGDQIGFLEKSTPNADNNTEPKITGADQFIIFDPTGIGMTMIAMIVVFGALAFLTLFFKLMGKLLVRREAKKMHQMKQAASDAKKVTEESGEVIAAISLALHLYSTTLHDTEDPVVTINRVSKTYSPWSSKIYSLRKSPR